MKTSCMRGAAALFALTTIVAACDDGPAGTAGEPRVSILLTDAPGDVAEARIVIDEIAIMGDADASAVVLSSDDWEGDLLDLRNTFATLVDEVEVPVGAYHQVRLKITEGCIETEDGDVFATVGFDACGTPTGRLQMPSYAQSGLKIQLPPEAEIRTEGRTIVLLDFNVAESFGHEAGNSNMWVMTPVIRATEFELSSNVTVNVALAETVTLPEGVALTDFAVSVDGEPGLLIEADGSTLLRYLVAGERTIDILPPAGYVITTEPATPYTFDLAADSDVTLDFTISSFAEAPPESGT